MQAFDEQAQTFAAQIEEELEEGRLNFPTALDVSVRIKRLADDPDSTLDQIATVVKAEPVLSAKAVRMANAVLLNPYGSQVTNVGDAVRRIGLSSLRCLAFAVAAEQLAQDHRSKAMRLIASGLWMHSVDVAAWSFAFARQLRGFNADTAMLSGMMVDIGEFFLLARASAFPALESDLERFAQFVSTWSAPVGRSVLEVFELPEEILDAFEYEDPYGGSWPPETMGDLVFVAALAAETPNPFDNLLGINSRPSLLDVTTAGVDRGELDALLLAARTERQEILAAVCG